MRYSYHKFTVKKSLMAFNSINAVMCKRVSVCENVSFDEMDQQIFRILQNHVKVELKQSYII